MERHLHRSCWFSMLLCVVLAGCQSGVTVRVERLALPSRVPFEHPSGRALKKATSRALELARLAHELLDGIAERTANAEIDEADLVRKKAGKNPLSENERSKTLNEYEKTFAGIAEIVDKMDSTKNTGELLLDENRRVFGNSGSGGDDGGSIEMLEGRFAVEYFHLKAINNYIRDVLIVTNDFSSLLVKIRHRLQEKLDTDNRNRIAKIVDELKELLGESKVASYELGALSQTFGGFVVTGVYTINAADPYYRVVLDAPVAKYPFSESTVKAIGDSAAIIVFDDPVRARTHQFRNDPRQLVRNVIFLINKAMQAVAKYSAVGM